MDPVTTIGAQIERLTLAAAGTTVEIDGKVYSTVPLHDPREPQPVPETLRVSSLTALVDFVREKQDGAYSGPRGLFVHVAGPDVVRLHTGIFGDHNQRVALLEAKAVTADFPFDAFHDPETFNILVQSRIQDTDGRAAVLALVGNLSTEAVATLEDDGVSQVARTRAGVVKVAERKVPNPVTLRPWRTFAEVQQPASAFILRLRGGGDGRQPSCGLIQADGGMWRREAVESVEQFLRASLPEDVRVYA